MNLPLRLLCWHPDKLAARMARRGVEIVLVYVLIALLTPHFTSSACCRM